VVSIGLGVHYAWLLWGTGIYTSHQQSTLRQQIEQQIAHPRFTPVVTKSGPGHTKHHTVIPTVHIAEGSPIGIMTIPRIHLNMVVVEGTGTLDLRKGPGHYPGTAFPWQESGRVAIAGHRTTYLHPFWALDKLQAGDLIRIDTEFGRFDYRVTGSQVVLPSDTWVAHQTRSPTLMLSACTPKFSATHRLVVFAARQ
jgi:sortase A